ncbi:unnamed protein product [Hymenolepis diminuta]|uniref:Uncharacterized protein n=1 Tax=Hymenolepis diminuta TaxID=6216 RepID=A0A564XUP8_HYMDI|nr:unnamed protein product [Hymenolepis diminuta]
MAIWTNKVKQKLGALLLILWKASPIETVDKYALLQGITVQMHLPKPDMNLDFRVKIVELLMQRSAEGGTGGGEKWQWLVYIPMNEQHGFNPLGVYFQRRVYVVDCYENIKKMEMLDMSTGGQWTSLTFSIRSPIQRLSIQSMAIVGNESFVLG